MSLAKWLEETHSSPFELRRHFFGRFFESELISTPGQAKLVAGGAAAILISLSLLFTQSYYGKYRLLAMLDDPQPYHAAVMADALFVITLAMALLGLLTTLEWPALFPGLRDYMALAALPLRARDVFAAKFAALATFAGLATIAITFLPSLALPAVMANGYEENVARQVPGMFLSASLGALFVFFSLVAVQGALLNLLPVGAFPRVSLALQGLLLVLFLCALPFVFSVPDLHPWMSLRPEWAVWIPPLWFFGLDQVIAGHSEPLFERLAGLSIAAVAISAGCAVLAYWWSYRRHRTRVLESPAVEAARVRDWLSAVTERLLPNRRGLAVFDFIARSLARSRQHRLILTAFAAIGLALVTEEFAGLALGGGDLSLRSGRFRQAIIAAPLALSLFTQVGLRYLFRLPVELRANWIFRVHEPGYALDLLSGAERFFYFWGIAPVAVLTLPVLMRLLGLRDGLIAGALCLLASLTLAELLLSSFERIPFTSSYLPGQRPLIDTVLKYSAAIFFYVLVLSGLVMGATNNPTGAAVLTAVLIALRWKLRRGRLSSRQILHLEFEELPEPAVQLLSIERD